MIYCGNVVKIIYECSTSLNFFSTKRIFFCVYQKKFFFFFEKQTHTHKRKRERGSNTKAHHNSTQKSWLLLRESGY